MKYYSKTHLLKALKAASLPATYKSLIHYEAIGIIPPPENEIVGFGVNDRWRMYSEQEIEQIVQKVKQYKSTNTVIPQ